MKQIVESVELCSVLKENAVQWVLGNEIPTFTAFIGFPRMVLV